MSNSSPKNLRNDSPSGRWQRFKNLYRAHRAKSLLSGLALVVGLVFFFGDELVAGRMQRWAERTMNAELKGYTVHIGRVRPHLWRLAFDLNDLVLVQDTHPDPPVADFASLRFSLEGSELLHLKVAGNLTLVRPALHIDFTQIKEEVNSEVSLKERGWQRAVESVFPFKLDRVKVQDGSLLYRSAATEAQPIRLTKVFMVAKNIRNIAVSKSIYPSPVTMEGTLFDTGKVWFKGEADFLREPYVAAQGAIRLERVPLDRLSPLAQDYQLKTSGGLLSLRGAVEYTPEAQMAHLSEVEFEDMRVDYVTSQATKEVEAKHAKQAVKLAKQVRRAPTLSLRVDSLRLKKSQIGFVNQGTTPPYRVFVSQLSLELAHLNNQASPDPSTFHAQGAFMGSGATVLKGKVQSSAKPADFEVHLEVQDAKLPALNDLLKAHGGVDVAEGQLSVFSELTVKNGHMEGYLKPLFKNLKIYERQKDEKKPFGQRVKMHVLQFLANLFRNHSTHAVATVAHFSGSTSDPKANEWEVIRKLVGNGFFRAVLPGFQTDAKATPPQSDQRPKPRATGGPNAPKPDAIEAPGNE